MAKGQGLVEYSLAAGVILLLTVGGLTLISNNFIALFEGANNQLVTTGPASSVASGVSANASGTASALTTNEAPAAAFNSSYPVSAAGFEQMMNDLPQLIETSGASGTSKELMTYLGTLSQKLLDNNEISTEDYNMLMSLSNAGHRSAQIQAALENTIQKLPQSTPVSELHNMTVSVEGESKLFTEWMNEFRQSSYGFDSMQQAYNLQKQYTSDWASDELISWEQGNTAIGKLSAQNQLLAHYKLALDAGALRNDAVAQVVETLSLNVININDHFQGLLRDGGRKYNGQLVTTAGQFTTNMKSQGKTSWVSHSNSAGICETGGGKDSGTLCGG